MIHRHGRLIYGTIFVYSTFGASHLRAQCILGCCPSLYLSVCIRTNPRHAFNIKPTSPLISTFSSIQKCLVLRSTSSTTTTCRIIFSWRREPCHVHTLPPLAASPQETLTRLIHAQLLDDLCVCETFFFNLMLGFNLGAPARITRRPTYGGLSCQLMCTFPSVLLLMSFISALALLNQSDQSGLCHY